MAEPKHLQMWLQKEKEAGKQINVEKNLEQGRKEERKSSALQAEAHAGKVSDRLGSSEDLWETGRTSLKDVITTCIDLGLLPDNPQCISAYKKMKLGIGSGTYDPKNLIINCPPPDCLISPGAFKSSKPIDKARGVLFIHEVLHNLHDFLDPRSYYHRNLGDGCASQSYPFSKKAEEQLTITGKITNENTPVPATIQQLCNPSVYCEFAICENENVGLQCRTSINESAEALKAKEPTKAINIKHL